MKKLLLFLFCLSTVCFGANNHRILSADNRVTNLTGWELGAISATDTLIWDAGTGFVDTMGVGWKDTVAGIRVEHGYDKNFWSKTTNDSLWINGNVYINKGPGYWYPQAIWIQENNSNFWIDTCTGFSNNNNTLTLVKKGTDTIKVFNGSTPICGSLVCAYPGKTTYVQTYKPASEPTNIGTYSEYLKLMGGELTFLGPSTYFNTDKDTAWYWTDGSHITFTGAGSHFAPKLNGVTHHLGKFKAAITSVSGLSVYTILSGTQNIYFYDSIIITGGGGLVSLGKSTAYTHNYRYTTPYIDVGQYQQYNGASAYFSGSTVNFTSFDLTTIDTDTGYVSLGSTVFTISGNFKLSAKKAIDPGTSTVTIDSTSTVTTANKTAFYDLTINPGSGKTVTLADSLILASGGDLTVTSGTLLGKSKNYHVFDLTIANGAAFNDSLSKVYIAGNATFGSTSTRPTSTGKYIFSAGTTHSFATGGRRFDSVSVLGSTSISVSDTMGLFMAPAVRVTNANTITLLAYDIEGSTGSLDSLTGGTINVPANDTLDFIYLQGVTLTAGDTLWVKTSGVGGEGIDGGGNSGNIVFLTAAASTGFKKKKGLSIGNGLMITTD